MRAAAIDLGTNSFLCLIAESAAKPGDPIQILEDNIEITRLGEGVHQSRQFAASALARAEEAFKVFRARMDHFKVEKLQAVATSAARDVKNADLLFKLGARYGIPIQIISGEEEARLTFDGANFGAPMTGETLVIDVGGGSTEIVCSDPKNPGALFRHSFDIGAVRLTELFVTRHPIPAAELKKMGEYIDQHLSTKEIQLTDPKIIGVAGTPTSLAAAIQGIAFQPEQVEGFQLSAQELKVWVAKLASMSIAERAQFKGIGSKRADVIVAGALILQHVLSHLHSDHLSVSIKGLRYGLIAQILKN